MAKIVGHAVTIKDVDGKLALVDKTTGHVILLLHVASCDIKIRPNNAVVCEAVFYCGTPD
jgi:hypothetical protein